ncbi:MAG: PD-(D/E)XK motif protein [Gammaproteobacteria bacterium]|nr:PD-(D/E)XK motif protein [Gammaproteobacteria bacterium]
MDDGLENIFRNISPPGDKDSDKPVYAVMPVPDFASYFVGKDRQSHACLLIATGDSTGRRQSPIRLESLEAQFEIRCQLKKDTEPAREGVFTVVRCRSPDPETVTYFLSICQIIAHMIGDDPRQSDVASAVHKLAAIFQKMKKPPSRPLNGLFGELYVISRSGNASRALTSWRLEDTARFDFSDGDVRLDVKVTSGRVRAHTFSYDQCNPPPGTLAVAASLFVERAPSGISLQSLVAEIEMKISARAELTLKLHEVLASTLGTALAESLPVTFDARLAESTLQFFMLDEIPAIREALPAGVTDVHFRSDLTAIQSVSVQALIDRDPVFWDLLPRREE